jgi:hypothetical protein
MRSCRLKGKDLDARLKSAALVIDGVEQNNLTSRPCLRSGLADSAAVVNLALQQAVQWEICEKR